jgi:dTDP-D-glucose 4,6-dehydratase
MKILIIGGTRFFGRRRFVMDTHKAHKDLGFTPTAFDTWMRKTIRWYTEDYTGGPPENYSLRAKEIEFIRRYKVAVNSV